MKINLKRLAKALNREDIFEAIGLSLAFAGIMVIVFLLFL